MITAARWSVSETVRQYQEALKTDPKFAAKIDACGGCRHRVAGRCTQADQLVSILALTGGECPAGKWPGQQPGRGAVAGDVDVIITAHNYGRFLAEAIESVLASTVRPRNIVVVDDASDDDTPAVAARFTGWGVTYLRVEHRHVLRAREAGFNVTDAPFVMFLDADDKLHPEYLEGALRQFGETVGVVGSDFQLFGNQTGTHALPYSRARLEQRNTLHAGAVYRRAALDLTRAMQQPPGDQAHEDWAVAKAVVGYGWKVAHNPVPYLYRKHGASMMDATEEERRGPGGYFKAANLERERVTLFCPLSGRPHAWPAWSEWLAGQDWPREQLSIVLADCSGRPEFGAMVKWWVALQDFPDARVLTIDAGQRPGLADVDRRRDGGAVADVRRVVARIYARMQQEVRTEYVWVVEDDVIPPADALQRLLWAFGPDVASVSAAYRSRYYDGFVGLDERWEPFRAKPAAGAAPVRANGFGCVVLRNSVLQQAVFTNAARFADYDLNFYDWLSRQPYRALLDWSVECEHLEAPHAD